MIRLSAGRVFWGLILTALGVIWLLNNVGATNINLGDLIGHYWPLIPIYFGVTSMYDVVLKRGWGHHGILWGSLIINALFTLIFTVVLGNINFWWSIDLSLLWKLLVPAVLLTVGVALMVGGFSRPGARTYWGIMSGVKDVRNTWDDLAVITVMGGATIDLTPAGLPDRDVLIDVYAIMGGGDIKVPEGVTVVCEWTGVMGGVSVFGRSANAVVDHRTVREGEGPVVRVRALTVMGGYDIKRGVISHAA